MTITLLWPVDRSKVFITSSWQDHLNRPGYNPLYAGTDLAGQEMPLMGSHYNGKVLQAMWSNSGYGYTTFVEYGGIVRIRNAHQKDLRVSVGDIVNPDTVLGIMDSTGNSTGTHTHFEVWILRDGVWRNVDPLDTKNGIILTNNRTLLESLDGSDIPEVKPVFDFLDLIPQITVKPTPVITSYINMRKFPMVTAAKIGEVRPGDRCTYLGYKEDWLGNIWFLIRKHDDLCGWCAAYYGGEYWIMREE